MHNVTFSLRLQASLILYLMKFFPAYRDRLEKLRKKNVEKTIRYLKKKLEKEGLDQGRTIPVDKISNLSEEDFIKNYFNKQIPVVFSGEALDWNCCKSWKLDYLKERYADRQYNIVEWLTEREFKEDGTRKEEANKKISGEDFVDSVRSGKKVYLRGCPILEEEPELLNDLNQGWLDKMQRCLLGVSYQSFISSGQVTAPLHNESTSFFFIMAEGEKKWTFFRASDFALIAPETERIPYNLSSLDLKNIDSDKFPGVQYLDRFECEIQKGDILFVPAWMWHFVETHTESWAVSYKFTSLRSFLSSFTFVFDRIIVAKPNIFETLYYSFFRSDMGQRDKNNLIPKLFIKKKGTSEKLNADKES